MPSTAPGTCSGFSTRSIAASEFINTTLSSYSSAKELKHLLNTTYRSSTSTTLCWSTSGLVIDKSKIRGRDWLPGGINRLVSKLDALHHITRYTLPMLKRSRKPLVIIKAHGSPLRSNKALVATVVPIRTLSIIFGETFACINKHGRRYTYQFYPWVQARYAG